MALEFRICLVFRILEISVLKNMIISSKELLTKAQEEGYAVGAFNTSDLEITKAIFAAVEKMKSPLIIQTSEGEIEHGGKEIFFQYIKEFAEKASVPVNINLDHGKSFEICKWAIDVGYTSVMLDGSELELEENIALTKKVADYAHAKDVVVEGEVGLVPYPKKGESFEVMKADPIEAERFAKETGVDFLAAGFGSVHGAYKGNPKLDFELLKQLRERINIPLILHGGSDISEEDIKKAVSMGICKVNVNTEIRMAFANGLREVLKDKDIHKPYEIMKPVEEKITDVVKNKIEMFGSENMGQI